MSEPDFKNMIEQFGEKLKGSVEGMQAKMADVAANQHWIYEFKEYKNLHGVHDFGILAQSALFFKGLKTNRQMYSYSTSGEIANASEFVKNIEELVGERIVTSINRKEKISCFHSDVSFVDIITESVFKEGTNSFMDLRVCTLDDRVFNALKKLSSDIIIKNESPLLHVITGTSGGMASAQIGRPAMDLEVGNYSEIVVKQFEESVEELNSENPFGRLTIINGPPGGGKTYLVRSLIGKIVSSGYNEFETDHLDMILGYSNRSNRSKSVAGTTKVVFMQPDFLLRTHSSSLMSFIVDSCRGNRLIIIIEDADECLLTRQSDNMKAVSDLLNLTDGLLGHMMDIRIVATTNAKKLDIDSALLRPGRLSKVIEIGVLSQDQASVIYKRLTKCVDYTFEKPVMLANVYSKAYEYIKNKPNE